MSNCPNCGAPVVGDICPYCGTAHRLPTPMMAIGKVVPIRFEHGGTVFSFDLLVSGFEASDMGETCSFRDGFGLTVSTLHTPELHVSMSGTVIGAWYEQVPV